MTSLFVPIFRRVPRREIELLQDEPEIRPQEIFKINKDNIQYMSIPGISGRSVCRPVGPSKGLNGQNA